MKVLFSALCALFLASSCQLKQTEVPSTPKRPNILFIMSDDHAYQAVSAYGYNLNNIDRHIFKKGVFWKFGIDGMPDTSPLYRTNQDSEFLFNALQQIFITKFRIMHF